MITTKQRAKLRGLANSIDTILYIGKAGIIETTAAQFEEALLARELIKAKCLEAAPVTAREAAQQLAERTGADIVQVIGSKFVLYKRNPEKPQIVL
jgi:RNA-binding protein